MSDLDFDPSSAISYFESKGWAWRREGGWLRLRECPICRSSSRNPFALEMSTGAGKCHHCGWVGGLFTLRRQLGDIVATAADQPRPKLSAVAPEALWRKRHDALVGDQALLTAFTRRRGLTRETVERFRFGASQESRNGATVWASSVPYFHRGKFQYVKLKLRCPDGKKLIWREPQGAKSLLFNVDALRGNERAIVCEGEEDCAVLTQLGLANVVSVPDGATMPAGGDRASWLDPLEGFRDVVILFDLDTAGKEGAERLARLLGREKCRIARLPEGLVVPAAASEPEHEAKDPTDFVRLGMGDAVLAAIESAKGWDNPLVKHIADVEGVDELIADHEGALPHGLPTGWRIVDKYLGGIRPGELSIVTGHVGSGKSAFVTNLAVQLSSAGTPALVASFELSLLDLRWRILQRIVGKYPYLRPDGVGNAMTTTERDDGIAAMRELPLYVVNRFGSMLPGEYIETAKYAERRFGCRVFVVDHLHFMTQTAGDKERFALTSAIYALKDLAIASGVAVVVVVHPSRHARDKESPEATDLHGAAALEQVADNVLTVARDKDAEPATQGRATLAIKKLRRGRSGTLGKFEMLFDRAAEAFRDPDAEVGPVAQRDIRAMAAGERSDELDDY